MKPLASILICTIEGRECFYNSLLSNIAQQAKMYGIKNGVDLDVLTYCDKRGEHSIGEKRNDLLKECRSEYACFIDDDDQIASTYLINALNIMKTSPDCINLIGQMTVIGGAKMFIHELKQKQYVTSNDGVYLRPPNHLNFIKTSISKQFKFPLINHGEDTDWAMQICRSNILKTEGRIEDVSYYYYPSEIHKK